MLELVLWDARAAVLHRELEPAVAGPGGHGDPVARHRVCHGVADEVSQHLGEPVRVRLEHAVDGLDAEVAFAEQGQIAAQVLEEVPQADGLGAHQLAGDEGDDYDGPG